MPRKTTKSLERKVLPDRKYQSVLVQRLINKSMLDGKKQASERAVYAAIEGAAKKLNSENPVEVLEKAVANVSPDFEVKSRRVGGATYQVPVEVRPVRQNALAMRWLIEAARKRNEKSMAQRLAAEFLEALEDRGAAVKKRDDTHRMAEANRAFAHFRW